MLKSCLNLNNSNLKTITLWHKSYHYYTKLSSFYIRYELFQQLFFFSLRMEMLLLLLLSMWFYVNVHKLKYSWAKKLSTGWSSVFQIFISKCNKFAMEMVSMSTSFISFLNLLWKYLVYSSLLYFTIYSRNILSYHGD